MFPWPNLELDDYERRFVSVYRTDAQPGVLKRVYQIRLSSQANPDAVPPIGAPVFSDSIQIARRTRVFLLTFQGDVSAWRLGIQTTGGEQYSAPEPQTGLLPLVSAMTAGSPYNAGAAVGEPAAVGSAIAYPMAVEPNWELLKNTTLIFNGALTAPLDPTQDLRFLSIGIHVWEFPGM